MSKTIEISRELAEDAIKLLRHFSPSRTADAISDLLAAPVVERQEPVAWALDVEGYKTVIIDNYQRALSEQEHFHGRGRTAVIRDLYTSPPAPVAVALPPDPEKAFLEWASTLPSPPRCLQSYLAAIDKVKELNQ